MNLVEAILTKSSGLKSESQKTVKSVKESYGGLTTSDPNFLCYRGEVRGYKFPDDTALTISSFSGFGHRASYIVQVWDSNDHIEDEFTQHGDMYDAVNFITDASRRYKTAFDYLDHYRDYR